jgi:hypothetical protein
LGGKGFVVHTSVGVNGRLVENLDKALDELLGSVHLFFAKEKRDGDTRSGSNVG